MNTNNEKCEACERCGKGEALYVGNLCRTCAFTPEDKRESAPTTPALPAGGVRLAPLVPEADIVSAIAAKIVRDYEEAHEWETMDATDVTVCARLNGSRAAL